MKERIEILGKDKSDTTKENIDQKKKKVLVIELRITELVLTN